MDELREGAVLATGLTFFCEDRDALLAADASTGMPLWQFRANQIWRASPMSYMFDNARYFAVASISTIV